MELVPVRPGMLVLKVQLVLAACERAVANHVAKTQGRIILMQRSILRTKLEVGTTLTVGGVVGRNTCDTTVGEPDLTE